MISQIVYIENFIEKNTLKNIICWAKTALPEIDETGYSPFKHIKPDPSSAEIYHVFSELNKLIKETIEHRFYCNLFEERVCGITIYPVGSFINEHSDDFPGLNLLTPSGHPKRHVSSTVYYNDEYTGGEIYFTKHQIKIKPSAGSLLLFPSSDLYPHQVLEVISGVRYATTNFWCGKEI